MKNYFVLIFFVLVSPVAAQQMEAQTRMESVTEENYYPHDLSQNPTLISNTSTTKPPKKVTSIEKSLSVKLKRNLKSFSYSSPLSDSLSQKKGFLQKLGCFLKEPLYLISLGIDLFELTKPPQNTFAVILYVIYIIPLFAIITAFILGGLVGLVNFVLASGALSFLVYWAILALLGITLSGNFIIWGLLIAFLVGLIIYLILVRLC